MSSASYCPGRRRSSTGILLPCNRPLYRCGRCGAVGCTRDQVSGEVSSCPNEMRKTDGRCIKCHSTDTKLVPSVWD